MVNRPRNIGTAAESAVVRVLQANGWPSAERRALRGSLDCGDVTGTPGIVWEVKAGNVARSATDARVDAWLAETERERVNAEAMVGVLVVTRKGIGAPNADQWWAVLDLTDVATLLACTRDREALAVLGRVLVRLTLGAAIRLLRLNGYGDPLAATDPSAAPAPTLAERLTS